MTGTASQIEWAERIRPQVNSEFDRVAKAFAETAARQDESARAETFAILEILEEKRAAVMANQSAGYFLREWQELRDQVRQLIASDARFEIIRASREARSAPERILHAL